MSPIVKASLGIMVRVVIVVAIISAIGMLTYTPVPGIEADLKPAESAMKSGDVNHAKSDFARLLTARPHDFGLYKQIIGICHEGKQWNLAMDYTKLALAEFKDNPQFRADLNLSLASAAMEADPIRPNQTAIYAAETALQLNPVDPSIQNGVGYILADNGEQLDKAMALIKQALDTVSQSTNPSVKQDIGLIEDSYGWALYKKGRYLDAADILLKALYDYTDDTPGDVRKVTYYHLGATYRRIEDFNAARGALRSALFYDPNYADAKAELEKLPEPPAESPAAPVITSSNPETH